MDNVVNWLLIHGKKPHREAARAFLDGEVKGRTESDHIQAAKTLKDAKAVREDGEKRSYAKHWSYADPELQKWADAMIQECRKREIPLYAFELHRTPERQQQLLMQGTTKAGPWQSPHQYGQAIDLIHKTKLWSLTDAEWELIGTIGKEIARKKKVKITWGGDWGWDMAHWEMTNWRESDIYRAHRYMERKKFEIPDDTERRFERYKLIMAQMA
jgi:hypothetical protein